MAENQTGAIMASIVQDKDKEGLLKQDKNGLKRIQFLDGKSRKTIRLGRLSMRDAETVKGHVEAIISARLSRSALPPRVASWLGELDDKMLKRLRAVGLAEGVGLADVKLSELLDKFFATLGGKPATRISYGNVRRNLE